MTLLCLLCAIASFALFGLATDSHHQQRFGTRLWPARQHRLRRAAWAGTALCLTLAVVAQGAVYGPILWLGALSFGAAAVFLFLNLAPSRAGSHQRRSK